MEDLPLLSISLYLNLFATVDILFDTCLVCRNSIYRALASKCLLWKGSSYWYCLCADDRYSSVNYLMVAYICCSLHFED